MLIIAIPMDDNCAALWVDCAPAVVVCHYDAAVGAWEPLYSLNQTTKVVSGLPPCFSLSDDCLEALEGMRLDNLPPQGGEHGVSI